MTTLIFATEKGLFGELVAAAQVLGGDIVAAALGPVADETDGLAPGATKVLTVKGGGLDSFDAGATAAALAALVESMGASRVLVGGNRRGKEIAPRLAAKLGAAYVVTANAVNEDGTFERKYLGGRTLATEKPATEKVVATIAPHSFEPATGDSPAAEDAGISPEAALAERVSLKERETAGVNIEEADIVVAFGRGIKKKEDMDMVFDLAKALGGEVGCTRPIAADLHWLGDDRWIGLSGKVVKPKLYLAIGISGQIQHLAGCRDAGTIVVVNTDKNAPFFEHADYGVVGDLYKIVPALIKGAGG